MNKKNGEEKVKLSRIARIDAEIRSGRYPNSEELAAKLEVSPRTILRDIDYLKDFYDAPIDYDFFKRGFYYTEPNFFIRSVMLSKEELETIKLFDQFSKFSTRDDNDLSLQLRKIIDKLLMVLPEEQSNDVPFAPIPGQVHDFLFQPTQIINCNIAEPIRTAITNKEVIEIKYWITDNRKWVKEKIEPLYLFYQRHHYYVLAFKNGNHEKPGIYSVTKIDEVYNTHEYFEVPANFKVSDYVKKEKDADVSPADNKVYHFELSFPKEIASEAIEKTYYHNQQIKLCEDGTVYVSFRSTQLHAVFDWVLRQGHRVKVLNPPELVRMIRREAQQVVQYYI